MNHDLPLLALVEQILQTLPPCCDISLVVMCMCLVLKKSRWTFKYCFLEVLMGRRGSAQNLSGYVLMTKVNAFFPPPVLRVHEGAWFWAFVLSGDVVPGFQISLWSVGSSGFTGSCLLAFNNWSYYIFAQFWVCFTFTCILSLSLIFRLFTLVPDIPG